jgi:Bacterial Ig-like domain (group 1)
MSMTEQARRLRRSRRSLYGYGLPTGGLRRTFLLTAIALVTLGATASAAAAQLNVYVGYADTVRAKATHFPTPWAPSVHVYGNNCVKHKCDTGTIRLVNNGKKTVTVKSVVAKFGKCTFNSWPHNLKIRPGRQIILSNEGSHGIKGCSKKVVGYGFDTSEIGPNGANWKGHCNQSHVIPQLIVSTSTGTNKFRDTGKVLNTGGIDKADCPKKTNESTQWTLIGRQACPTATLTLAPPSQKDKVGTKATVTATLKNSGGKRCGQPLRGARVNFRVLSGPNKGKTGSAVTNKSGQARFKYSSSKKGTDKVQASVKNPVGRIFSKKVKVMWTKGGPKHRAGTFSCVATGANLLGTTFAVANPLNSPCATHQASVVKIGTVLKIKVAAIKSNTFKKYGKLPKAGDSAIATSKVAKAMVGLISGKPIKIGVATSTATDKCVAKGGKLSLKQTGKSTVAYIMINGKKTVVGNKPMTIPVGPLATIYLNRQIKSGNTLTQRAVEIDLLGSTPSVILAQSAVDFTGNPCGTA